MAAKINYIPSHLLKKQGRTVSDFSTEHNNIRAINFTLRGENRSEAHSVISTLYQSLWIYEK